jgi:hypothetical protein
VQTIVHADGSKTHLYEKGDFVRIIKPKQELGFAYSKVGDWGKVFAVDRPGSSIALLRIQVAGYSYDKEAFFQSMELHCWNVEPCDDKGNPLT